MQRLFEKALLGDATAEEEIARTIRRIAEVVCGRGGLGGVDIDWEDVAQEASQHFFAVAIHRFRTPGSEESYLYAIVRTKFLQSLRAASRRSRREDTVAGRRDVWENADPAIDVRRILDRISGECARLLEKVFLQGITYAALSSELDMLESSVRTKVSRCLRSARTMTAEAGGS
jgi:RNA polymerase sigma factor (sigma-70 family)